MGEGVVASTVDATTTGGLRLMGREGHIEEVTEKLLRNRL